MSDIPYTFFDAFCEDIPDHLIHFYSMLKSHYAPSLLLDTFFDFFWNGPFFLYYQQLCCLLLSPPVLFLANIVTLSPPTDPEFWYYSRFFVAMFHQFATGLKHASDVFLLEGITWNFLQNH